MCYYAIHAPDSVTELTGETANDHRPYSCTYTTPYIKQPWTFEPRYAAAAVRRVQHTYGMQLPGKPSTLCLQKLQNRAQLFNHIRPPNASRTTYSLLLSSFRRTSNLPTRRAAPQNVHYRLGPRSSTNNSLSSFGNPYPKLYRGVKKVQILASIFDPTTSLQPWFRKKATSCSVCWWYIADCAVGISVAKVRPTVGLWGRTWCHWYGY